MRTHEPMVALTFDDGPDPRYTPTVLRLLRERDMHATFFTIGVNALAYPSLVRDVLDGGHQIANHTYDHPDLQLLSDPAVAAEIDRGAQAIVTSGAPEPTLFRPPKGYTDEAVGIIANTDRYQTVFWDLCLEHFLLAKRHRPVPTMLRKVKPGSILLAHDGGHVAAPGRASLSREATMAALPSLLDGLTRSGLHVVDVATLLRRGSSPA